MSPDYDDCEICCGFKGGYPGNENVVEGMIVCDFCHADILANKLEGDELITWETFRTPDKS